MDPNRSLHRHREQFAMSRGLAWVYWRGGSIFGSEKRCWTTKLSVMNNAFNYVFYESLLAMIILSRNFFFLWGKVTCYSDTSTFSCTVTLELISVELCHRASTLGLVRLKKHSITYILKVSHQKKFQLPSSHSSETTCQTTPTQTA